MVLGEWQGLTDSAGEDLSPDLPVFFYQGGSRALPPDTYCEGGRIQSTQYWDGRRGWQPCIVVNLGEAF